MLRKDSEREVVERVAMRDGPGVVLQKAAATKEEMLGKCRLLAEMILNKDCGIGFHVHEGEMEVFVIEEGKAMYRDDDKEYEVSKGDVVICESGHGHGITNYSDEPCKYLAMIVLE